MTDFRTLKEWDKAHNLTVAIYKTTQSFPESELLGLTQQICLACSDIPIKIAQGCDREEKEEKISLLKLAKDSAIKVEYYLLLSYELNFLNISDYDRLVSSLVEVKEMLASFIHRLNPNS
ncbi:MAG: four helix bundle protein [Xenococcaceae cyanobacterium]